MELSERYRPAPFNHMQARAQGLLSPPQRWAKWNLRYIWLMDTSDAGRLGATATNKKLSKKQRKANARRAAKARWAKRLDCFWRLAADCR
jgi:hypothetical protein